MDRRPTWILTLNGKKIACDPCLSPKGTQMKQKLLRSFRQNDPSYSQEAFKQIDLWLLTHNHGDHLDEEGLAVIRRGSTIVTHHNALSKIKAIPEVQATVLNWGERTSYRFDNLTVEIEAIPAIHGEKFLGALLTGGVNGYWITARASNETFIAYLTSDTVADRKVLDAICDRKVDLLIPNMGAASKGSFIGTLTLTAEMLVEFLDSTKPTLCLPVHHGTFGHFVEPISEVEKLGRDNIRVLEVGESIRI